MLQTMTQPHSPDFIAEMKERLLAEQQELEAALGNNARVEHGSYEAKLPEYERDMEVNAMESADAGAASATTEAEEERLKNVLAALGRIAAGTYGVTTSGELIPEARLRANPAAIDTVRE